MATRLLLLKDVDTLGRSGDIVNVRPGYARNFLLPQGMAVIASAGTLRMQENLQKKRQEQASADRQESEQLAARIEEAIITKVVKVDPEGHMYGSVTVADIQELLQQETGIELERRVFQVKHAIKSTGVHQILVRLKEGVTATFNLKVMSEEGHRASLESEAEADKAS